MARDWAPWIGVVARLGFVYRGLSRFWSMLKGVHRCISLGSSIKSFKLFIEFPRVWGGRFRELEFL